MQHESTNGDRPFWLEPPWSLLIDPSKAGEDPWSIDVAKLIIGFLNKMREMECLNYWISGKALLSASIIHRLKSELLLELSYRREENNGQEQEGADKVDIPPIPMPFRITSRKVTLSELIFALQQALLSEEKRRDLVKVKKKLNFLEDEENKEPEEVILEALHEDWDLEAKAREVYSKIISFQKDVVAFSSLTNGQIENVIETFLALLFLALKEMIYIWQERAGGEIYVVEGRKWKEMLKR